MTTSDRPGTGAAEAAAFDSQQLPLGMPSGPEPEAGGRSSEWGGGESEAAKSLISRACDAYVMHGDPPERIAPKIDDLRRRRDAASEALRRETGEELPPLAFGMAAYAIVRDSEEEAARERERITNVAPGSPGYGNYQEWIANTKLEQRVSLEDYSVSNRGLRAGLVGTGEQVAEQIARFAAAGVDLLLLQCSPQLEEMERFAAEVITPAAVA
jgi:FMNH2-dependent dimethyl sulfone monooxygenase